MRTKKGWMEYLSLLSGVYLVVMELAVVESETSMMLISHEEILRVCICADLALFHTHLATTGRLYADWLCCLPHIHMTWWSMLNDSAENQLGCESEVSQVRSGQSVRGGGRYWGRTPWWLSIMCFHQLVYLNRNTYIHIFSERVLGFEPHHTLCPDLPF